MLTSFFGLRIGRSRGARGLSAALLVALMALGVLSGCSSESDDAGNGANQSPGPDAGPGGDTGPVADAGADADAGDVATAPKSCTYQNDCGPAEICHGNVCREAPTCRNSGEWKQCIQALDAIEPGLGRRGVCREQRCKLTCLVDSECAQGETCTDDGMCVPFTGEITGLHPGGGERQELRAGIGNTLMHFPIGLSMGGYGSRAALNAGRYVESLRPSHGQAEGLYARSIALDNGERQMVMVRLPIIFPSMALHEAVCRELQRETGRDWRDSLIISGTHTHSGPTRFWNIPRDTIVPLGALGVDEFHQQGFDWMVQNILDSARAALADLQPARVGWTIVEAFDRDDMIASDRWGETPPFDDNRMLILRVDDLEGTPRGVLVSFGMHSTFNSTDYFTGDAASGVEEGLQLALAKAYDRFVPVMFFNENGGNMSPRGDRFGHDSFHVLGSIGHQFAERAIGPLMAIETTRDVELKAHTLRFPMTYEILGYEPGEWTKRGMGDYHYGGVQCMAEAGDGDFGTHVPHNEVGCLALHQVTKHRPLSLLSKSQITAFQINDLTVVTLPGEPTMEVGWQVLREARDRWGLDPLRSFVWGYAQDHLLYISPTNLRGELPPFPGISTPKAPDEYPDYAFSYFQGGYEASMTPWGWRMGDFIVSRASEALGLMLGEDLTPELPQIYPAQFSRTAQPAFPVDLSEAARMGTIVQEPSPQVVRLEGGVNFAWVGGDPGAEMPQAPRVVLERQGPDGTFAPILDDSRRVYDNRTNLFLTRLRKVGGEWQWVVYWEEMKGFALGTYRFRVEGHYQESAGPEGRKPYTAQSRPFEVVPSQALHVTLEERAGELSVSMAYPTPGRLRIASTPEDPLAVRGSYRMRHPGVPSEGRDPVVVGEDLEPSGVTLTLRREGQVVGTVTGEELELATRPENVEGRDNVPVTRGRALVDVLSDRFGTGSFEVTLEVTDRHGNSGSGEVLLEL